MKKHLTERGLEAAGKMLDYAQRKSSPGAWDWWEENGTFDLVIPVLAAMKLMNEKAATKLIVVKWALYSDPARFIDTMLEIDPWAVLAAAKKIDLRQNPEILEPIYKWIEQGSSGDKLKLIGSTLPSAVADYISGGDEKKNLLDLVCRFDLTNLRWKNSVSDMSAVYLWAMTVGDMFQKYDTDRSVEALKLLIGAGANINDHATTFATDGTERDFQSVLEWGCFMLDDESGVNYKSVISQLLYSGGYWGQIDPGTYPESWKLIQAHPVVLAKDNREALTQIAKQTKGFGVEEDMRRASPKL